jgi:hypothetical protein
MIEPIHTAYNRYPGLKSFEEGESRQFFGRKVETGELLNNILTEQLMVLFSKSGVGKSSLLNAGIIPLLKKRGYYPLKIRFQLSNSAENPAEITPLSILKANLRNEDLNIQGDILFQEDKILFNKEAPNLWEYIKAMKFPEDRIPVLIFDQFEEFFSYSDKMQHEFLKQMAELLHSQPPNRIINWIGSINLDNRTTEQIEWIKQPPVKFVFAIRDDRLSELDSFKTFIPLILKNRYKLNPLSLKNAQEAIEGPASMADGEMFKARKFAYNEQVVHRILDKLLGLKNTGEGAVKNTGIDGSQLQKVCSFIERKVIEAQKHTAETIVVDDNFLDVEHDVQLIIDNFYTEQINLFFTGAEVEKVKDIIEEHFVVEESRVFVLASQLRAWVNHDTKLIQRMLNARLIKEEHIHLGKGYELSHDTLVPSVIKSKAEKEKKLAEEENRLEWERKQKELEKIARIEKKRKRIVFYFSLLLILSITTSAIILYVTEKNHKKKYKAYFSKIYNYEAHLQYENGNLIYAAFLAKLLKYYNSQDTSLISLFNKNDVFPFSGEKVAVSADERLIGTLWDNGRLNIWSARDPYAVQSIMDIDSVVSFSFLGDENFVGVITASNKLLFFNIQNYQPVQIQVPNLGNPQKDKKYISIYVDNAQQFVQIIQMDSFKFKSIFLSYPGFKRLDQLTETVDSLLNRYSFEDYFLDNFYIKNFNNQFVLLKDIDGKCYKIDKQTGVVIPSPVNNYLGNETNIIVGQFTNVVAFMNKNTLQVYNMDKDSMQLHIELPKRNISSFWRAQFICADKKILIGKNFMVDLGTRRVSEWSDIDLSNDNKLLVSLDSSHVLTITNNVTNQFQLAVQAVAEFEIRGYNDLHIHYLTGRDTVLNLHVLNSPVPTDIPPHYILTRVIGKQYYQFFDKKTEREIITYSNVLRPPVDSLLKYFKPFIQKEFQKFAVEEDDDLIDKVINN